MQGLQPPRSQRRRTSTPGSTSSKSSDSFTKQGWAQTKDILSKWAQVVHAPSAAERQQREEYWTRQNERMGKTIILPVRVEPKVQFANERTFLNWMHFVRLDWGVANCKGCHFNNYIRNTPKLW